MNNRKHYFALAFYGDDKSGGLAHSTTYVGFKSKLVTRDRIEKARMLADMSPNSALLAASYLGFMTDEEMFEIEE